MKKELLIMFFILILITACKPSVEDPQQSAAVTRFIRSGTYGLDMKFLDNMPPNQVYDTNGLTALVEVRNMGSYDIKDNECFLYFGGFDTNIIRGINQKLSCGQLEGKSLLNIDGGFDVFEFRTNTINLPPEVDLFKPPLQATACYEYQTVASPQVCIDPSFYDITAEQKACIVRDFGMGGGQGAPVAITSVNVDMSGNKAIIQMEVANLGGGKVVSPRVNIANKCPVGLEYGDVNELFYKVDLFGGTLIKCSPSDSKLMLSSTGRGKIVCTFDVGNVPAFETMLRVELNYNYMQSISKSIEIVREP